MPITCRECNCFRKENPEPVAYIKKQPIYIGICLCNKMHVHSNESPCIDYYQDEV